MAGFPTTSALTMATFPSLRPSNAPITPGAWPVTAHTSLNGAESRIRHGSAEIGRQWRPSFVNITEADFLAILNHYRGQRSGFDSFGFDTTTLAADLTPAGFAWIYASRPKVVDQHVDCFTVQCEFKCEPRGLVVAPGKTWRTAQTTFSQVLFIDRPFFTLPENVPTFSFPVEYQNQVYGYKISREVASTVQEVGVWAAANTDHTVGIWSNTGSSPYNPQLVWQKQVRTTDPSYVSNGYRWYSVSNGPTILANIIYTVAATWGTGPIPAGVSGNTIGIIPNGEIGASALSPETTPPVYAPLLTDLSNTNYFPSDRNIADENGYFSANLIVRDYL